MALLFPINNGVLQSSLECSGFQVKDLVVGRIASEPSGKADGYVYYNTTSETFQFKEAGSFRGFPEIPDTLGDVVGPDESVAGQIASFDGITGKLLQDSGVAAAEVAIGAASATNNNVVTFSGSGGKALSDSGISITDVALVATDTPTTGNIVIFGSGTQNIIDSGLAPSAFLQQGTTLTQHIDADGYQLLRLTAHTLATEPSGLANGHFFYDTGAAKFKFKENGSYVTFGTGAGGSGDVVGPGSSGLDNVAYFTSTTGKAIGDTGISRTALVTATGNPITDNIPVFSNTRTIVDSGISMTDLAHQVDPANGYIPVWNGSDELVDSGITAASISALLGLTTHDQNTDAGTTNATFYLNDETGPKLKGVGTTAIHFRNAADDAFVEGQVGNLTVNGTLTVIGETNQVQSNEVNIGDSMILLNADVSEASENANGGFGVKLFDADDTTRKDAEVYYDLSTGRWKSKWKLPTDTQRADNISMIREFEIGDGSETDIVVNHGAGTRAVKVDVFYTASPYGDVQVPIQRTDGNNITLSFGTAPASNEFTVVVAW